MKEYATEAIKADRKRRGEPVAWQLRLPDGRVKLENEYPAWADGGDGYSIKPLYAIPQPAAPSQEPRVPEGWRLVPVEPTPEMVEQGIFSAHGYPAKHRVRMYYELVWEGMLAAAPKFGEEE